MIFSYLEEREFTRTSLIRTNTLSCIAAMQCNEILVSLISWNSFHMTFERNYAIAIAVCSDWLKIARRFLNQ